MGNSASTNGNGRWIVPAVLSALLVVAIFVFGFSLSQAGSAAAKAESVQSALAEYKTADGSRNATNAAKIQALEDRLTRIERMLERLSERLGVPVPPRVEYEQ